MSRPDSYDASVYQPSGRARPIPVTAASRAALPPPRVKDKWLTVQAIAAELEVSKMTVYRLVHAGDLPAKRIGRSLRVSETAFEEYLRAARADDFGAGEAS